MQRRSFLIKCSSLLTLAYLFPSQLLAKGRVSFIKLLKETSRSVYSQEDEAFHSLKEIINKALSIDDPLAIIQTKSLSKMRELIKLCHSHRELIRVRSGGHSFEGFSMGKGVVFDMRKSKQIKVERSKGRVCLGAGLTLKEVIDGIEPEGLTFPVGSCPSVGIAGYLLGGGHSLKSRSYGLAADRVQSMLVVLASGEKIEVSPNRYSDLYWALLGGGGGNFAIVEEFRVDLMSIYKEIAFDFTFSPDHGADIFNFWEEHSYHGPDEISAVLILSVRGGRVSKLRIHGVINRVHNKIDDSKSIFEESIWVKLRELDPLSESIKLRSSNYVRDVGENIPFKGTSHYAQKKIGSEGYQKIVKEIKASIDKSATLVFEPMGGVIDYPRRNNSYPHRDTRYIVEFHTSLFRASTMEQERSNLSQLHKSLDQIFSQKCYINYPDFSLPSDWPLRYYGDSLLGLIDVKRKYDPQNLFDYGTHCLARLV